MRRTAPKLLRHLSSDSVDSVRVGRAVTRLRGGGDFKPVGALATLPPRLGATLEWLCQKDALGQDALLICAPAERAGAPGRLRLRRIGERRGILRGRLAGHGRG